MTDLALPTINFLIAGNKMLLQGPSAHNSVDSPPIMQGPSACNSVDSPPIMQGPSARNSVELGSFCYYFFCLYLTFGECCESVP